MFKKRAQIPIESRSYGPYYLLFSGLLFLGTMWAVVDEVSTRRPWKDEQRRYYAMLSAKVQERLAEAIADMDSLSYMDYREELRAAQDSLSGNTYRSTLAEYNRVLERLVGERREFQFAKSRGDEAYYFHRKSLRDGKENVREKRRLEENEAQMALHQAEITVLEKKRDSLQVIISEYRANVREAQSKVENILKDIEKWQTKLRRLREVPIEIKQVMMLDYDRNPFNDPKARVDRCESCHLGWKEELMKDAPQPFRMHPRQDLLETHNPEVFGCTPCHRGQGPALTAGFAHGEDDHYWENPLLRGIDVYASCNSCHSNQSILASAPPYTEAKRLMIESGCHGCHEIKGYADLPKIGPDLSRIAHKTNSEWVYRWVKDPKSYNPHTRMPDFKFSEEEAEAVTAYLMNASSQQPFTFARGSSGGGNRARGKELVETAGCMGCHVVGQETRVREIRGSSYDIAPELTRLGSKVEADWLYDWLRNPRHYNPTTRMPSLRITDGEARDIVAYLTTMKDDRRFEQRDIDVGAGTLVARGEKLVREYGCNGCHVIPGMEKEGRVSVSLSNFGRKHVEEMDFGDTRIPHTWHDWVETKLKNSRAFQTDRIEQKMPVFSFTEYEVKLLRMFLLSLTKDEPDPKYVQKFDRKQKDIETGRRLAILYNCQQCHELEGEGGYIGELLEEQAVLPPILTRQGAKVQEPWLHAFLKNPTETGQPNSVRPWIPIRMPTFQLTDTEITALTKYFLGLSNQELELRDYKAFKPDPFLLPIGKEIFTDFQCTSCHPATVVARGGSAVSTADLAPNLMKARDRLKPEWIVDWLADPGRIQPGTRMPTYFPDGQSPLPDLLDGDARLQMQAIRDYVMVLGEPVRTTASIR